MPIRRFFTEEQERHIVEAINTAEGKTSGEIRVHIEERALKDPYQRAIDVFNKLKMHQTRQRNGVLFYLATEDHAFVILGDEGINKVVPNHFWNEIRDEMQAEFKQGHFEKGLIDGILKSGRALKEFFPHEGDDAQNELPNDISTSPQ